MSLNSGSVHAIEENLIPGLSISLEGHPVEVSAGQTFTMRVVVINHSGRAVTARLRTYLYGHRNVITYPPPDPGFDYVCANVGDWLANEVTITVENGVTRSYDFELKVLSDVKVAGGRGGVTLRARIRETGRNVKIAPDSDKAVSLIAAPAEWGLPIPLPVIIGIIVALIIAVVAVVVLKTRRPSELPPPPPTAGF